MTDPHGTSGFDAVIVVAGSPRRAAWWRARLAATRSTLIHPECTLVVVEEPWPAGNALGTLLALEQARAALGVDLARSLDDGRSVAVVHAAGAGSRMACRTPTLDGDKARLPLSAHLATQNGPLPITALEAVLRSTAPLAAARGGRLSVWWADQLIAPSRRPPPSPVAAAIAAIPLPALDADRWSAHRLERYGVLATPIGADRAEVGLVEKLTWSAFGRTGLDPSRAHQSLGAFHLDAALLADLRALHAADLAARARLDTDRGWWMPLSLSAQTYTALGGDPDHHLRLAPLRHHRVGVDDLGPDTCWWDLGHPELYDAALAEASADTPRGDRLRSLLRG